MVSVSYILKVLISVGEYGKYFCSQKKSTLFMLEKKKNERKDVKNLPLLGPFIWEILLPWCQHHGISIAMLLFKKK